MRNRSWQSTIRLCLAVLCIAAISGIGSVAAHQRGDASLPEDDGGWTDLGIEFITPDEQTTATITGDTYVLPATGTEVIVGSGVTADDPATSGFEDQVIVDIPSGLGAVAVISGLGTSVDVMEAYVGGFAESAQTVETIDIQESRTISTGLYLIELEGLPLYFFIVVDAVSSPGNFIIQVAVSMNGDVDQSILVLRENVLVDGMPMFSGVDEVEIQNLVEDYSGI